MNSHNRITSYNVCYTKLLRNTFCIPEFELYVGGHSGSGAVDDSGRLCEFIYRNLHRITQMIPTMDTHQAMQIFHAVYLIDADGKHPDPVITSYSIHYTKLYEVFSS